MAGSMSDYAENKTLDAWLGNTPIPVNTTLYLALYTATPSDSGGGTEVSGGSYVRLAVTNNSTNFPAAASGSKTSGAAFTFVTATASWGTVTAFGIFDAASGGNLIYWDDFTGVAVGIGDTATFASGAITVTQT